jgi:cyclopropane-fatty-acyl-phospholipid synthase
VAPFIVAAAMEGRDVMSSSPGSGLFGRSADRLSLGEILEVLTVGPVRFRFTAYDGSGTGPRDAPIGIHLRTPRGAAYLATAPGSLGMTRAYVMGDLQVHGIHPGDPYPVLSLLAEGLVWRRPDPGTILAVVRSLGVSRLLPPKPPPQESLPDWRRALAGLRHSRHRDASAISHHYDVSNRFYELLLGQSMTYSCACYPDGQATLERAQVHKYDLVARKLGLKPGMRLLDIGCGWGGMLRQAVTRYGVTAVGVTLSGEQARWAAKAIAQDGISDRVEVRHCDYRDVTETGFDAISSLGFMEHVGIGQLTGHVRFLFDRLRPGGRLLNHCITRPDNLQPGRKRGSFIDRYIFPDGELTGSGRITTELEDTGLEVRHAENLREHYARTCQAWNQNLITHWDECVAEVGEPTAKIWALFLAGSRLAFERNQIQLHQVLAVRPHPDGRADYPLRPQF